MTKTEERTAVTDTNVLISSFLSPSSTAYRALGRLGETHKFLLTVDIEEELKLVVNRPKFDRYLSPSRRLSLLSHFIRSAELIAVLERITVCRDPKDDKFLEAAVAGGADLILSGDADLLALHPFRGIAILTPAAYLASVGETF